MAAPKGNKFAEDQKRGPGKYPKATKEIFIDTWSDYSNGITIIRENGVECYFNFIEDLLRMNSKDRANIMIKVLDFIIPKQSVVGVGLDQSMKDQIASLFPFAPPDESDV